MKPKMWKNWNCNLPEKPKWTKSEHNLVQQSCNNPNKSEVHYNKPVSVNNIQKFFSLSDSTNISPYFAEFMQIVL